MKRLILLVLVTSLCLSAYSQKKYSDAKFVGKTFMLDTSGLNKEHMSSLVYDKPRTDGKLVGPRLVRPASEGFHNDYNSLVGKNFKCLEAKAFNFNKEFYLKLYSEELGTFYSVSLNSDYYVPRVADLICIEDARGLDTKGFKRLDSLTRLYANKILWIKSKYQNAYNAQNNTYDNENTTALRFNPVTVTKFTLSDNSFNPYRVFAKTSNGKIIYFDFELDKGARYGETFMHYVNGRKIFEARNRLTDGFFTKKPGLTPSLIRAIKKGDIYIGMSSKVVELIKGKPDKINRTTNAYGVHEQWVYHGEGEYYYFDNDQLTSVQN